MKEFMLPCLNKAFFGIDCPGCGAQRALLLLLEGNWSSAYHMYPAIFTLVLFFLFLLANFFVKFRYARRIKTGFILLNAGIIITSYVSKMLFLFNQPNL